MKIPRAFYTINITKSSFHYAIALFTKENGHRDILGFLEGFLEFSRTGFSFP